MLMMTAPHERYSVLWHKHEERLQEKQPTR